MRLRVGWGVFGNDEWNDFPFRRIGFASLPFPRNSVFVMWFCLIPSGEGSNRGKKARKSGPRKPENGCINLVGKQHKMINLRQSGSWAAARQKGFGCCFPVKRIFGVLLFRGKGSKVVLGKSFPHTLARFLALLLLGGIGCKPILLWPNRKSGWKNQNQTSFAFKGINEMFDSG